MGNKIKENYKADNQYSLGGDEMKIDRSTLRPTWKIYLGIIWGIICVGLFIFNPLIGIIAPIAYVIYLCIDAKFESCYKYLLKKTFKKPDRH